MTKRAMACNWLRMTSSDDNIWPSGSTDLLTNKKNNNKPKAEHDGSAHAYGCVVKNPDFVWLTQKH